MTEAQKKAVENEAIGLSTIMGMNFRNAMRQSAEKVPFASPKTKTEIANLVTEGAVMGLALIGCGIADGPTPEIEEAMVSGLKRIFASMRVPPTEGEKNADSSQSS